MTTSRQMPLRVWADVEPIPDVEFLAGSEVPTDEECQLLRCFSGFCKAKETYCPDLVRHRTGLWQRMIAPSRYSTPSELDDLLQELVKERDHAQEWRTWLALRGGAVA